MDAKRRIVLVFGVLFSLTATSLFSLSAQAAYTLKDAVHETLASNPDILSAKSTEAAVSQDVREIKGEYLPSVTLEAGVGKEHSDNPATHASGRGHTTLTRKESEIFLRQLLYDGGFVKSRLNQSKSQLDTSTYQIAESQESLAFQASQAYLQIMRDKELVDVRKSDVAAHETTLVKVKKRLKGGAGRKSEINLVEGRLALSEARLDRALGNLLVSKDGYVNVVGRKPPKSLAKPPRLKNIPVSLRSAEAKGMEANPSIKAVESEYDARKYGIGIAKSAFHPVFNLDLSSTYNSELDGVPGHNNDAQAMVRMQYNIFRGGSDKAATRAARHRAASARHDIDDIRRSVNEDVAVSWNNLKAAEARLPHLKEHKLQSYNVFNAYIKQFQLGQRTLFDLLNAETEYYDARSDLVSGRYEILIGRYRLLASMGILVNTLNHQHQQAHPGTRLERISEAGQYVALDNPVETMVLSTEKSSTTQLAAAPRSNALKQPAKVVASKASEPAKTVAAATPSKQGSAHYTVQLLSAKNHTTLKKFVEENGLNDKIHYTQAKIHGDDWHRLMYGDFASYSAAKAAINDMPYNLQSMNPVVRRENKEATTA